jgi:uncharacterized phage protein gp47/JayE
MSSVEAEVIYRNKEQIVASLIAAMMSRIPDIWTEEDGVFRLLTEVFGGEAEGVYLANQLLRDDMFITTATRVALRRHGEEFGQQIKAGTKATGTLLFSGEGGTFIPTGSQVASDPGAGDLLYYLTTADGTIPNPGDPGALTSADGGAGALGAGTYEYVVTFVTAGGETLPGIESTPLVLGAAKQISLTAIPLGGPGTTARKIYRSKDGGAYALVTTLANNVTVVFTDNVAAPVGDPPSVGTAERVTVAGEAEESGTAYNAIIGSITELSDVPDGVTDVTNPTAFSGGGDDEEMEDFRVRLLDFLRNPKTGSPSDMEAWAEEIEGVDTATAFNNDNNGVATNGHITIRIAGPDGSIPGSPVIDAVLAHLQSKAISGVTVHVHTFTPVSTAVTVTITLESGYVLADVTPAVQDAIEDYINNVPVGGTVYMAGLIDAVFGLPGVKTVVLNTPATDQTATATQKRTPGVITVN